MTWSSFSWHGEEAFSVPSPPQFGSSDRSVNLGEGRLLATPYSKNTHCALSFGISVADFVWSCIVYSITVYLFIIGSKKFLSKGWFIKTFYSNQFSLHYLVILLGLERQVECIFQYVGTRGQAPETVLRIDI